MSRTAPRLIIIDKVERERRERGTFSSLIKLSWAWLHFANCQHVERIFSRMHRQHCLSHLSLSFYLSAVARSLIIMDSHRDSRPPDYLANFDWISSRRSVTVREYNRSLIENLIHHEIANKSTGESKVVLSIRARSANLFLLHVSYACPEISVMNGDDDDEKCADKALRVVACMRGIFDTCMKNFTLLFNVRPWVLTIN